MAHRFRILLLLISIICTPRGAQAQDDVRADVISGTVVDAATGGELPGATIQIIGTYRGTIANARGRFQLRADRYPVRLLVRFIGYESRTIDVAEPTDGLSVELVPVAFEMPEVVITGEDPAVRIMRRVIEEKQRWQASLETYSVDAYNRFRMANDTGIVSIWESRTRAFWHREHGVREVSLWQEQTENMDIDDLLPAAMFVVNLYDDDIFLAGHTLRGVTHPDALDAYRFRLTGVRAIDDQQVFDISVEPKRRTGSGFRGTIAVLDSVYAMIHAELEPAESFLFPPPIERMDIAYEQQFSSFGGDVWLPVDLAAEFELEVSFGFLLNFPVFRIGQMSRLSDFQINIALPDSLFESDDVMIEDSTFIASVRAAPAEDLRVPLTPREELAYATIDSTMTMEKAFKPGGLLGRFVNMSDGDDGGQDGSGDGEAGRSAATLGVPSMPNRLDLTIRPDIRFDRVEALRAGGRLTVEDRSSVRLWGGAAYLTGPEQTDLLAGASAGEGRRIFAEYYGGVRARYRSAVKKHLFNSASVLIGRVDYYDWYESEGWRFGVTLDRLPVRSTSSTLSYRTEHHRSMDQTIRRTVAGLETPAILNAPVSEGSFRSVSYELRWDGDDGIPLGIGPLETAEIEVERGFGGSALADEGFWRVSGSVIDRIPTFYRRRLIPNALDVRINAGWSEGSLPPQRLGIVDGSGTVTEFGNLRTRPDRPYQAGKWLQVSWEHSFRTIPFEMIGWRYPIENFWNVLITGGHAWADDRPPVIVSGTAGSEMDIVIPVGTPAGGHHEIGLSVSGILTAVRLDASWRLDEPGLFLGIGLARIF